MKPLDRDTRLLLLFVLLEALAFLVVLEILEVMP